VSPGLGVDCTSDLHVIYEELLEEALVGQPPDLRATASVQLVASPDEGEFEDLLDSAVDDLCRGEHAASSLQLPLDAFLFLSGEVFGDGAGDQAAGESAASFSSPDDASLRPGDLRLRLLALLVKLDAQPSADVVLDALGQPKYRYSPLALVKAPA
jgi:hypothetical protein